MSPITMAYILSLSLKIYSSRFSLHFHRLSKEIFKIIENLTSTKDNHIFQWMFIWILRLLTLICLCGLACGIALAESHGDNRPMNQTFSMVDIGFTLTKQVHLYLHSHPIIHHWLALFNTLGVYFLLGYTVIGIGYWQGRPGLIIVEIFMFLARLICGWLTQLPYSDEYLASNHDFPDCLTNQFRQPTSISNQQHHASFFFFFSGHVGLVSLVAVYFSQTGRHRSSYACNIFNILQIIRLLATRGHYTIDLIGGALIGSYMYTFVADVDKYLTSFMFIKHLVRKNNTKLT